MGEVVKTAQARESYLASALENLTQLHEAKMGIAEEIINQQRRLLEKLREECRNNVEVDKIALNVVCFLSLYSLHAHAIRRNLTF